jgi:anti-anti-sigma factor
MMKLSVAADDGVVVRVRCEGEISEIRFQADGNPLENLLGPGCYARKVLLDLERADWIDSSGINWLVRTNTSFKSQGGSFVLFALARRVDEVLKFCKMERIFRMAPDEATARALAVGGAKQ